MRVFFFFYFTVFFVFFHFEVGSESVSSPKEGGKECIGNTALCKVKRASSHDFQFVLEVITPSQRVYILQAQTEQEYEEWFYVLSNQCARLLLRKNTIDRFRALPSGSSLGVDSMKNAERVRIEGAKS